MWDNAIDYKFYHIRETVSIDGHSPKFKDLLGNDDLVLYMKKQIVVIRYLEDISWTESLENVIIYNKGNKLNINHPVINLPNIGMYHASQLYHIIENYNNLAEITLFIQADPFDGDYEVKNNFKNNLSDVKKMIDSYFDIPSNEMMSANYFWQLIGDKYNSPHNYNQRHHDCFLTCTHNWNEWIKEFVDCKNLINWEKPVRFYRNGHMAIKKEAILSNKIDYYIKIMEFWKYDVPITEWFFESTSNFIFNIGNDGKLLDLGHNDINLDDLENYKNWMYELEQ